MNLLWLSLGLAVASCSQNGSAESGIQRQALAADRVETRTDRKMDLSSPAFPAGGTIPLRNSAYGEDLSPPLHWSGTPREAKALAIIMEDPDARSVKPYVHWLAWNISPALLELPEGIAREDRLESPVSMRQGRNSRGRIGYFGPRPSGSAQHHYHFQIFALAEPLALEPGADRAAMLGAMAGRVLAKGHLVALFARPPKGGAIAN